MKRTLILSIVLTSAAAYAHPGKTDAKGGHFDSRDGYYHSHNPGEPERQEPKKEAPKKDATKKPAAKKDEPKKKK